MRSGSRRIGAPVKRGANTKGSLMPLFPAREGATLRVRLLGRGQPVLMLHGLGMQGRDWLPFVFPFLRRFQFVIPVLRGAGGSSAARHNQAVDLPRQSRCHF